MTASKHDENISNQYLTFTLREEDYAIDIAKVREVLDVTAMTKIPQMPSYISGVINLRGNVVPVLDLGARLGMSPIVPGVNTCVMIVETEIGDSTVAMGALSDSVQMVLDIHASEIEEVPRMGTNIDTDFISGMGRHNDKFLIILNIDKVLAQKGEDLSLCLDMDTLLAAEPGNAGVESGTPMT